MKLSKELANRHAKAEEILKKDVLTYEEKLFVLENWHEGATHMNGQAGAFFTPFDLAKDFSIEIHRNNVIDLCAGIGMLAFIAVHHKGVENITCLELNSEYVRVGKKILPEAHWIQGSVLDKELIESLGTFDLAISNPPFGNIKSVIPKGWLNYTGANFEYKVVEVASKIAREGVFILPQNSTPFVYSGTNDYKTSMSDKLQSFIEQTQIEFEFNCGIDTAVFRNDWKGVSPICEIVTCDFTSLKALKDQKEIPLFAAA